MHWCNLYNPWSPRFDEINSNWSGVAPEVSDWVRTELAIFDDASSSLCGWATEASSEYNRYGRSEVHISIGWYGSPVIHEVPVTALVS